VAFARKLEVRNMEAQGRRAETQRLERTRGDRPLAYRSSARNSAHLIQAMESWVDASTMHLCLLMQEALYCSQQMAGSMECAAWR
jgi:hypothetical protein